MTGCLWSKGQLWKEAVSSAAYSWAAGWLPAGRGTQGPTMVPWAGRLVGARPGVSSGVQGWLPQGPTLAPVCLQIPSEVPRAVPQSPGRTILPAVGVTAVNQNYFGAWLKKRKGWPWSGRENDGRKPTEAVGGFLWRVLLKSELLQF